MTGLIVALDDPDLEACDRLAKELADHVSAFKVGLTLFTARGPDAIHTIGAHGLIFCDLKMHDIPEQVRKAAAMLASHDVWLTTVHASGGPRMIRAAVDGAGGRTRVAAVTILTSLTSVDLPGEASVEEEVERLALLGVESGADSVVASGREVANLRRALGPDVTIVVPGVRPVSSDADDQERVATPAAAASAGGDYVVVGRPITRAADPISAAREIVSELEVNE